MKLQVPKQVPVELFNLISIFVGTFMPDATYALNLVAPSKLIFLNVKESQIQYSQ